MQNLSLTKSPSFGVVMPHYLFAAISFFVLTLLLFASSSTLTGHYFHPKLLAITHIAALGWASMIIFGALYQLLPVILGVSIFSELLAKVTFVLFGSGIIALAFSFWNFYTGIHIQVAAISLLGAFILYTLNILLTCVKKKTWAIEVDFIVTSAIWLLVTAIIGGLMAFNFEYAFLPKSHLLFLKIHAHTGMVGWLLLLVMGVASKLVPMFLLAPLLKTKKLTAAYYLVNLGLIGFSIDMYVFDGSRCLPVYAFLIVSGIAFFVSYLYEGYKLSVRKKLDIGLKHSFFAFLFIFAPAALALIISFNPKLNEPVLMHLYLMYGISFFLGFITTLILGQTLKTLPFIVWLNKYQKVPGNGKTTLPKDLYCEIISVWQLRIYTTALVLMLTGVFFSNLIFIRLGAGCLILTSILYNFNVFRILFYSTNNNRKP